MSINPYPGNKLNFPISIPIPDSGEAPTPATLLAATQANRDSLAYYNDRLQAARVRNWQPQVAWSATSTFGPHSAAWDPAGRRWLICGVAGGLSAALFAANGQGDAPTPFGSTPSITVPVSSVAVDSAGDVVIAAPQPAAGVISVSECAAGGLTWQNATISLPAGTSATDAKCVLWGSGPVRGAFVGNSGGTNSAIIGSVTAPTLSLTTEVTPGTGAQFGTWILKTNGAGALAIPASVGAGAVSYVTVDGITWGNSAGRLNGAIGASDFPLDVAWNAYLGKWLLVTILGSGGNGFYTSPDGLNWTPTGTTFSTTVVTSLEACDQLWVATVAGKVIYSFDGVTWYGVTVGITSANTFTPKLVASPRQLLLLGQDPITDTSHSIAFRFSFDLGPSTEVFTA